MLELDQLILEAIDSLAQKRAVHTEPCNKLCDMLALKSVSKLKGLARAYRLKGYTKMDKEQLVSAICTALVDLERIEQLLYILETPEWSGFERAAKVERLPCDGVLCAHLDLMQSLGYVQTYFFDETLFAVVPLEIREAFQALLETGFRARKERGDLLHTYAAATINLYGVISQEEFVSIFNAQNAQATDIDEVFEVLTRHILVHSDYCFWDEYIVSDSFEEDAFTEVEALLQRAEGKPRYIPPREEFLKYCDTTYYEPTAETRALTRYLNGLVPDIGDAESLTDEICFECAMECRIDTVFDLLEKNGVVLHSQKQVEKFANLLMHVKNNSRIWSNKGHTPNEIFEQYHGKKLIPFPSSVRSEKIGSNDPCPCGSGKKYKKCCRK